MPLLHDLHPKLSGVVKGGVVAGLSILLGVPASSPAADPAPAGPVPVPAVTPVTIPALSLEDCLHLGRTNQPSIAAAAASLASAQDANRGLNGIKFGSRLSKELPIRKQQSSHGIAAAQANLCQVQRDVDASVARLYFSVVYARMQLKVAQQITDRLKAAIGVGETLVGKEGAPPDLTQAQLAKAKLQLPNAQARVLEATRGLQRAHAALREAMGMCPEFQFNVSESATLPPVLKGVNKDEIVRLATCLRGEVAMTNSAVAISQLEIEAQAAARRVKRPTAAAGGDFHSRPVPSGSFGDDYKPGAIGPDFPTMFVGPKDIRVQRASDVFGRSAAAAEKTHNLVALEAEDTFFKWEESVAKIGNYTQAAKDAEQLSQRMESALSSGVIQSYRDVLETLVLGAQIQSYLNEAHYNHAVSLTELERVTAGGFPTVTVNVP